MFSAVEYLGRKGYDGLTGSKTADDFVGCWMDHDPRLMGGDKWVHPEAAACAGGACAAGAVAAVGCGAQKTKVPFVGKTVGTDHSEATVSVRRRDATKY